MAWETLKGQPHNIDLVLTEVELPSISGFALLTLVTEHDICKNIPVIMMSSHDSISMVLNCMLKGAVDFLIKPVRRNELKNLWQHVWRRRSLLGEHISQNLPVVHYKAEATSGYNEASNDSSDYATSLQKNKGCEKVSDAQSSCTSSPYLEAESAYMQNMQDLSQLKCRRASNICDPDMEQHDDSIKMEAESVMPESTTGGATNEVIFSEKFNRSGSEVAHGDDAWRLEEDYAGVKTMPHGEGRAPGNDRINANITSGILGFNYELIEPSSGAIDLIGTFDNHRKSPDKLSTLNDGMNKFEIAPELELSLSKSFLITSHDQGKDERHTLNHSTASAFSWYNNSKTFPTPTSNNTTKLKDGASKSGELLSNQLSENAIGSSQQCGAKSSNYWENMVPPVIGHSEQVEVAFPRPYLGFVPVPGVRFYNISAGYRDIFPSMFYAQSGLPPVWSPKSTCQQEHHPFSISTSVHSNPDVHDSEQGYRKSDELTPISVDQTVHEQNKVEPLEELRHGSPTRGQSSKRSLCNGLANNNSGVVCSRNEGNAFSSMAIEKGTALQNTNEGTLFIHDGFNSISSHRSSKREAALTKFRLKRKDRCYEKKVQYQSRKSLAEQRPRVKGQFVRQVKNNTEVSNADGCP